MSWLQYRLMIARAIVMSVLQGMVTQINIMDQQAKAPVQRMIQEVAGGSMWKGKGAQAFQEVMQRDVIRVLNDIMGRSDRHRMNIQGSLEVMDAADLKCRNLVNNLRNTIEQI